MFFNWLTKLEAPKSTSFSDFSLIKTIEFLSESSSFISNNDVTIVFAANTDFSDLRTELYGLANHFNLRIIELGQLKKQNSSFHLQFFKELTKNNKIIFIGESNEYELSIDLALKAISNDYNKINISNRLLDPNANEYYLGYQRHLSDLNAIKNASSYAHLSLGAIEKNITKAESIIRDSKYILLNCNSLKGNVLNNGNNIGLDIYHACSIAKYAGHNTDLKAFHIATDDTTLDPMTIKNIATMIWYFLEGIDNSEADFAKDPENQRYLVQSDYFEDPIVFIKSLKTGRWWIRHQELEEKYIPCDLIDYEECCEGNLPEKLISLIK